MIGYRFLNNDIQQSPQRHCAGSTLGSPRLLVRSQWPLGTRLCETECNKSLISCKVASHQIWSGAAFEEDRFLNKIFLMITGASTSLAKELYMTHRASFGKVPLSNSSSISAAGSSLLEGTLATFEDIWHMMLSRVTCASQLLWLWLPSMTEVWKLSLYHLQFT